MYLSVYILCPWTGIILGVLERARGSGTGTDTHGREGIFLSGSIGIPAQKPLVDDL